MGIYPFKERKNLEKYVFAHCVTGILGDSERTVKPMKASLFSSQALFVAVALRHSGTFCDFQAR